MPQEGPMIYSYPSSIRNIAHCKPAPVLIRKQDPWKQSATWADSAEASVNKADGLRSF